MRTLTILCLATVALLGLIAGCPVLAYWLAGCCGVVFAPLIGFAVALVGLLLAGEVVIVTADLLEGRT